MTAFEHEYKYGGGLQVAKNRVRFGATPSICGLAFPHIPGWVGRFVPFSSDPGSFGKRAERDLGAGSALTHNHKVADL